MARIWRKPGVLMTGYFVLFVVAEAWAATRFPTSGSSPRATDMGSPLIAAFLAWRVARGSSIARALIIVYTLALFGPVLWGHDMKSGGLVSIGVLACFLGQLALLVSTPVYERTRRDWADRPPSTERLWPLPGQLMAALAIAAGVLITLLCLGSEDFQSVPCALPGAASPTHCETLAQGFPVHFLSAMPGSLAYPVIDKGAAAEDLAVWTVLSFAGCYLLWLPQRRPTSPSPAAQLGVPA